MRIAEQVNKLGNTIRRHKSLHHLPLTNPTLYFLRMGQFHPDTIHTIRRMDSKFGHDHTISFVKGIIAIFHRQAGKHNRVLHHFQVGVQRIVAVIKISQGIAGPDTHPFIIQVGTGIMARKKTETQE